MISERLVLPLGSVLLQPVAHGDGTDDLYVLLIPAIIALIFFAFLRRKSDEDDEEK
ncbi:MAG: hypothetical protein HY329_07930 [Chloroflexi bacterium]|nr:hypothetical protein [Chloroflexota bacterium]